MDWITHVRIVRLTLPENVYEDNLKGRYSSWEGRKVGRVGSFIKGKYWGFTGKKATAKKLEKAINEAILDNPSLAMKEIDSVIDLYSDKLGSELTLLFKKVYAEQHRKVEFLEQMDPELREIILQMPELRKNDYGALVRMSANELEQLVKDSAYKMIDSLVRNDCVRPNRNFALRHFKRIIPLDSNDENIWKNFSHFQEEYVEKHKSVVKEEFQKNLLERHGRLISGVIATPEGEAMWNRFIDDMLLAGRYEDYQGYSAIFKNLNREKYGIENLEVAENVFQKMRSIARDVYDASHSYKDFNARLGVFDLLNFETSKLALFYDLYVSRTQ